MARFVLSVPIKNLLQDLSIAYVQLSGDRSCLYLSMYVSCRWKFQCYLWLEVQFLSQTCYKLLPATCFPLFNLNMTPADIEWTINCSCTISPALSRSYSYVDRANVTGRGTLERRNSQVERLWPSALAFVSLRAVYTVSNYNCLYA